MFSYSISVIIPVYNVEKYISECLDSLVKQTLGNMQIIVVDDESTDGSLKICKSYADNYKQIKIITIKHGGAAAAQQAGLEAAGGKYISFFGADDYASLEMYQKMWDEAERIHADVVECHHRLFWEDGRFQDRDNRYIARKLKKNRYRFLHSGAEAIFRNIGYAWRIHRRDFLLKYSFYFDKNIAFGEDFIWHFFPVAFASQYSIIEHTGYFYRQRKSGNQTNSPDKKLLDICKSFAQADFYIEQLPEKYLLKHYIQYEILTAIFIFQKLSPEYQSTFCDVLSDRWKKWMSISAIPCFTRTGYYKLDLVEYGLGFLRILFLRNIAKRNFKRAEQIVNLINDLGSGGAFKKALRMFYHFIKRKGLFL